MTVVGLSNSKLNKSLRYRRETRVRCSMDKKTFSMIKGVFSFWSRQNVFQYESYYPPCTAIRNPARLRKFTQWELIGKQYVFAVINVFYTNHLFSPVQFYNSNFIHFTGFQSYILILRENQILCCRLKVYCVYYDDLFVCDRNNTTDVHNLQNYRTDYNRKIYFHTNYRKWRQVNSVKSDKI